jgi:hypothetical protein
MRIARSDERKICSQNGEDGVLMKIFSEIKVTNSRFVEFGVGNGSENNTLHLVSKGWTGNWFDLASSADVSVPHGVEYRQARINAENVEETFRKAGVPKEFDLLSIDIDGNDYWVWDAIKEYRPRVVAIEYNGHWAPPVSKTVAYDPLFNWTYSKYFGATLSAMEKIARRKAYSLVYCESVGVNAFFVDDPSGGMRVEASEAFRPIATQFHNDDRAMQDV